MQVMVEEGMGRAPCIVWNESAITIGRITRKIFVNFTHRGGNTGIPGYIASLERHEPQPTGQRALSSREMRKPQVEILKGAENHGNADL